MKKYYIHNGSEQIGPMSIEELKNSSIEKNTPIWTEGMKEWSTAGSVEELKDLFKPIPPPFTKADPVVEPTKPIEKRTSSVNTNAIKPSSNNSTLWIVFGVIASIVVIVALLMMFNSSSSSTSTESYESKKMSIAEIEQANPVNFLDAGGTYNQNLLGTKLKVNGVIKNSATTTAYKDIVIEVYFYSKTKTLLATEKHTVYEVVEPNHSKSFEVKVPNYSDVNSIGWEVVSAKVY